MQQYITVLKNLRRRSQENNGRERGTWLEELRTLKHFMQSSSGRKSQQGGIKEESQDSANIREAFRGDQQGNWNNTEKMERKAQVRIHTHNVRFITF